MYALHMNCHSYGEYRVPGNLYSKENMEMHEVELNPTVSLEPSAGKLELNPVQENYSNSQAHERKIKACFF